MEWVKSAILKMAREIMADNENLESIILNLEKETNNIHPDIRHIENKYLIYCICELLLSLAEQKYGNTTVEPDELCMHPAFFERPESRVGVTLATPDMPKAMHIICVGSLVITWQQLFYELAHETLHLLGPTDTNTNTVARIEEGVAVKFAEEFYESFVFPTINENSYTSPLSAPASVYYKAHKPTSKIPDDVLKRIRNEFKNFRLVEKDGLYALTHKFITEDEAAYLSLPFDYNAF